MPVMLEVHWFALIMSIDISTSTGIYCEARIMLDDFRIALQLSVLRIKSLLFNSLLNTVCIAFKTRESFPIKHRLFLIYLAPKVREMAKIQEGSPFPAGVHKAAMNRRESMTNIRH